MVILFQVMLGGYEIGIDYSDISIDLVEDSPPLDYSSLQQISDTVICDSQVLQIFPQVILKF